MNAHRRLAAHTFDGWIALDEAFCITGWNPAMESLTGIDAANAIGRSLWTYFPDWSSAENRRRLDDALDGVVLNLPPSRMDGFSKPLYVAIRFAPAEPESGGFRGRGGVWIFLRDVTDAQRLARENAKQARAERAARADAIARVEIGHEHSERRLCGMIDLLPGAVGLIDPKHQTYLFANPALRSLGKEALVGRTVIEAHGQRFGKSFFTTLDLVCRTGRPRSAAEVPLQWHHPASGKSQQIHYDFFFQPIGSNGEKADAESFDSILLFGIEVTDQVRARSRAEESRRQMRRFVDSNIIGVVFFDYEGNVCDANGAFLDIVGYDRADLEAGRVQWRSLTPSESGDVDERAWKQLRSQGIMAPAEKEFFRKDGSRVPVLIGGALFEGSRDRGVGFVLNLSDRRRSEAALKESSEKLAVALEGAKMGTWGWDLPTRLLTVSSRTLEMLGIVPPPSTGPHAVNPRPFLHPEDRRRVIRELRQAIRNRSQLDCELRVIQPDGTQHWLLAKGRAIYSAQGVPLEVSGIALDVTAPKLIEKELREAVRARDEFLSIASHELRTPVTSMKLGTQIMKRNLETGNELAVTPGRLTKLIDQYDRQLRRLTALIEDMLDISRINTGKLTLQCELVDMVQIARDAIERSASALEEAGCTVKLCAPEQLYAECDRRRMEQVLTNLLTNAARYGAGQPIEIRLERHDENVALSVEDRGIGIAPENHERIFRRFERAVSVDEISGLGLGLYIVRRIVEAHRGKIELKSTLGKGALFTAVLPIAASLRLQNVS